VPVTSSPAPFERLADGGVQTPPAHGRYFGVQALADRVMGEAKDAGAGVLQDTGTHRTGQVKLHLLEVGGREACQHVGIECPAHNGCEPQEVDCLGREPRQALPNRRGSVAGMLGGEGTISRHISEPL
jgi:hypothetical protein